MFFRSFFLGQYGREQLTLDRPTSNFDVAGIPTESWSSSLMGCLSNLRPSCLLSFFCPCIMWSQVVVRAQIPLLISVKNSLSCLRENSGYRCFVDTYSWTLLIGVSALIVLILFRNRLTLSLLTFLGIVAFVLLGFLYYINGHVRTAFKMKYQIKELPEGCEFWECCGDSIVACLCYPCVLAQMARHVFQYDRWEPSIGMFMGDPYTLPPLENDFRRPPEADEAGLLWTDNRPHPNGAHALGRNNRPLQANAPRTTRPVPQQVPREGPMIASVVSTDPVIYNADGSIYAPEKK